MKIEGEQILLRAYLRTTDQHHFSPVYERLVQMASTHKMAGATVLKGILGIGPTAADGELHDSALAFSHNLPVIVECVESPAKIAAFLRQAVDQILTTGIVTLERARVIMWRHRNHPDPKPPLTLAPAVAALSTLPAIERSPRMHASFDGLLLRVFIGESDHVAGEGGGPLYKVIVQKVRALGLKGATVLRGSMGFGANSVLHTSKILELSTDLPLVIEIADEKANIEKLLPFLEQNVHEGMITLEEVRIVAYRGSSD